MSDWVPLADWRRLPAEAGVYVIRHRESGKEYVGLSQNVRQRVGKHMLAASAGSLLHRAIGRHTAARSGSLGRKDIGLRQYVLQRNATPARRLSICVCDPIRKRPRGAFST